MKLLILTQKVDRQDPILGFFHRWLEEFAKHYERVTVICLKEGEHNLPPNIYIRSLGKERGVSKFTYLWRFYSSIWRERKNYDAVFVHMNPEYVVLGGIPWRLWGKRVGLWYVHRQTNLKLRLAAVLAHTIFTSSPESFRLKNRKVRHVGHGIDTETFSPLPWNVASRQLLHVGRITPIKRCDILIDALQNLRVRGEDWKAVFVGPVGDQDYFDRLKRKVGQLGLEGKVSFLGPRSAQEVHEEFGRSFASVNMTPSGGMDKAVLESWAAGRPCLAANKAFVSLYGPYWPDFSYKFGDSSDLAGKVAALASMPEARCREAVGAIETKVQKEYDTSVVIRKISALL